MHDFSLPLLLALVLSAACSDPPCRSGEIKVGLTCYSARERDGGDGADASDVDRSGELAEEGALNADATVRNPELQPAADASDRTRQDGELKDASSLQEDSATAEGPDDAAVDAAAVDAAPADAVVACVPAAETCDGKDNDCDQNVDEGASESPIGATCSNGGIGACGATGRQVCAKGEVVCDAPPPSSPKAEVCDGKDNDCDGNVDDLGSCNNGQKGECYRDGTLTCTITPATGASSVSCSAPQITVAADKCVLGSNRLDDNCDGQIDEFVKWVIVVGQMMPCSG